MRPMYRAAVVGCGYIGSHYNEVVPVEEDQYAHAAAHAAHPRVELVGLCDPDPSRRRAAAKAWRPAQPFGTLDQMLRETSPEIVSICSPDDTHEAAILQTLTFPSVRAVLAEKPLALSVKGAARIRKAAAQRRVVLAVNYTRRYDAGHAKVHSLLQRAAIGKVELARGLYTKGILHNGSHHIDFLVWLFGQVRSVSATLTSPGRRSSDWTDPSLDCDLRFSRGVRAHLSAVASASYSLFELDILGTTGRIEIRGGGDDIRLLKAATSRRFVGFRTLDRERRISTRLRHATRRALDDVVKCLDCDQKRPRCGAPEALYALTVGHRLIESARTGRVVTVSFGVS